MKHCAQCGADLSADDLGGVCAACLLMGGLAADATAATAAAAASSDDLQHQLEFDAFGPYVILRVLGEGGMGTVYLAEQTSPIQRKVALKVVKPGWKPAPSSRASSTSGRRWPSWTIRISRRVRRQRHWPGPPVSS